MYPSRPRAPALLCSVAGLALAAPMAAAQDMMVEEIVVTAQKRSERLQEVPIALTAMDAGTLEAKGVASISALAAHVPNLQIRESPGTTTGAQISIRGGVTINPSLNWESTVGIYVDGVYIGKTQGAIFDMVDLERVEVLRGPQGTLYGRNTLAGAINMVSAKPKGDGSAMASATIGNYGLWKGKANVDLPSFGPLRVKLSAQRAKRDGLVDIVANPFPGVVAAGQPSIKHLQEMDNSSFRAALALDLTDNLVLDYSFDYSLFDQTPKYSQVTRVSPGGIFDPASPLYAGGKVGSSYFGFPLDLYVNGDRQTTASIDGPSFEKSRIQGHTLTATLELDDVTVKSISAARDLAWRDGLDLDGSPLPLAHTQRISDYSSRSQEFQAVGSGGPVNYVVGLYYFEDDGRTNNPQTYFGATHLDSRMAFTTKAYAAYSQIDYKPPILDDRLTLTGGLRYTLEEKSIDRLVQQLGSPNIVIVPAGTTADKKFAAWTPSFTANFAVDRNLNLYARYAEGYKSGGFNAEAGNVAEVKRPYSAEKVASYEAGAKATLWDGRLLFNSALFLNRHSDMQLSVFTATGAAESSVRNAGKAEISGLEVEATLRPAPWLTLQAGYGYLHAKYLSYMDGGVDVADNRAFPFTPKHSGNISADLLLGELAGGTLRALLDVNAVSGHYTFPYAITPDGIGSGQLAKDTAVGGYAVMNANLILSELEIGGTSGEVNLWVKNLLDRTYKANGIDFGPGFGGLTTSYYGDPRTYGITMALRW